jgi:dihydrofolate reductase
MKILVFIQISADGFFAGPNGEIDWLHRINPDTEWMEYSHEQARKGTSILTLGHTTYDIMKSFWPTEEAIKTDPEMARILNESRKIVFSKKLESVEEGPNWKNIRLLHEINPDEILRLKEKNDMTILGSGSIVQQFANMGLIDEYSLVVIPLILGKGKPLFENVKKTNLKLLESRQFGNGIVLLRYQPLR